MHIKGDLFNFNTDDEIVRWKVWDRILTISNMQREEITFEDFLEDIQLKEIISELSNNKTLEVKCWEEVDRWCKFFLKDKIQSK